MCSHNWSLLKPGYGYVEIYYSILFFVYTWKQTWHEKKACWITIFSNLNYLRHLKACKILHSIVRRERNGIGKFMWRTSTDFVIFCFLKEKFEVNNAKCADLTKMDCVSCWLCTLFSESFSECLTHLFKNNISGYLQKINIHTQKYFLPNVYTK